MKLSNCIFDTVAVASLVVGIALLALNVVLLIVGIFTFQILNPSYAVILAVCLVSWISAFALAAIVHLTRHLRETRRSPEGCCRRCGYDASHVSSERCPECGLSRYDPA